MSVVVIINGYPGAGKDAFVEECVKAYPHTYNSHTSDNAKLALASLGWNGEKTPEARKLLADLVAFQYANNLMLPHYETFVKVCDEQAEGQAVIFIHVREWENVQAFKRAFPGTITLFIDREEAAINAMKATNKSDFEAGNNASQYDFTYHNNGTLLSLSYAASAFMLIATQRGKQNVL